MDAIVLRNVTKCFRKNTVRRREYTTVKSELVRWFRRGRPTDTEHPFGTERSISALRDVTLTVPAGTTMGVIGRNGSGKSTLLKLITGIYKPTSGSVEVAGRISALLELGAGFHPDFSGRENIFINGIILGLSRAEIREKLDEIIEFSELGSFVDEPVRTYSSGMFMRLAFAVATYVDPDVLLIDEILSVGDEHFARKSKTKMEDFKRAGKTILLVTHDLNAVQTWCDAVVWIDEGRVREVGEPRNVVDHYRRAVAEADFAETSAAAPSGGPSESDAATPAAPRPSIGLVNPELRWGTFEVELSNVRLLNASGSPSSVFGTEDAMTVAMDFTLKRPTEDVIFGFAVTRADGVWVYSTNTLIDRAPLPKPLPMSGTIHLEMSRLGLVSGEYKLGVAAHNTAGMNYDYHKFIYSFAVRSPEGEVGVARPAHRWKLVLESAKASAQRPESAERP